MFKTILQSTIATLVLALICCGVYPFSVWALGQAIFSRQANGSLIRAANGEVVASALIGQSFSQPKYFHGRPSAAGDKGYDASNSSGSNLGPTNPKFADALKGNIDAFLKDNPTVKKGDVPTDAVTASASGLDPHVTPETAYAQVTRVAHARGISEDQIKALIQGHTEGPQFGVFGEPVVNIVLLNLSLDQKLQ